MTKSPALVAGAGGDKFSAMFVLESHHVGELLTKLVGG